MQFRILAKLVTTYIHTYISYTQPPPFEVDPTEPSYRPGFYRLVSRRAKDIAPTGNGQVASPSQGPRALP